jgi:hypothetical protein
MRFANVRGLVVKGVIVAMVSLAGSAIAQDGLGGPKVQEGEGAGKRGRFGGQPRGERPGAEGRPRHGALWRVLTEMGTEKAPAEVRTTDAQKTELEAVRENFMGEMNAYREQHAEEVKALMQVLPRNERRRAGEMLGGPGRGPEGRGPEGRGPEGRGPGGRGKPDGGPEGERDRGPDGDDMMHEADEQLDPAKAEAARARLKEIAEGAPKPQAAHDQVFAILNDAQDAYVKQRLSEVEDREPGEALRGLRDKLTDEQKEKLKGMSPEERREYIRELAKQNKDK